MRVGARVLRERAAELSARLSDCDLCPRRCRVDRLAGRTGFCGAGARAPVAAALAHFGEEPPISGTRGAGTVFFGGCNLRCCYCQNHQISRLRVPVTELDGPALARTMSELQGRGCHNIEWVTPSHIVPQALEALAAAVDAGLDLPLVYNSGGYDALDVLRALDGVVDVYLPDLKHADAATAEELAPARDYWETACAAIREMGRQVGPLVVDEQGIAQRGVIVRHLILPNDLSGSRAVLEFVAALDPRPALSLMAQFYPIAECDHPLLQRAIFPAEYARVLALLDELDLEVGWIQDLAAQGCYRPDFTRRDPFGVAPPSDARGESHDR